MKDTESLDIFFKFIMKQTCSCEVVNVIGNLALKKFICIDVRIFMNLGKK